MKFFQDIMLQIQSIFQYQSIKLKGFYGLTLDFKLLINLRNNELLVEALRIFQHWLFDYLYGSSGYHELIFNIVDCQPRYFECFSIALRLY
jgi:hypothetical protein